MRYERQVVLPADHKGHRVDCGYRMDLVVEQELLIEAKAVQKLMRIHQAQILTCLRLHGLQTALLMNFNEVLLKNGLRRYVSTTSASSACSAVDL